MKKKQISTIILVLIAVCVISYIVLTKENRNGDGQTIDYKVSDYKLLSLEDYGISSDESNLENFVTVASGEQVYYNVANEDQSAYIGFTEGSPLYIQTNGVANEQLGFVVYAPGNDAYIENRPNVPFNIFIYSSNVNLEEPELTPEYIGYADGTCNYPNEIVYVTDETECQGYLEDTLTTLGYNDLDSLLSEVFGDLIVK